jgi:hypothetical protein
MDALGVGRDHVGETGKLPSIAELRGDSEPQPEAEPAVDNEVNVVVTPPEPPTAAEPATEGEAIRQS